MSTNAAPAPEAAEVEAPEVEAPETPAKPEPKKDAKPAAKQAKPAAKAKGPSPWDAELDERGITDPTVREYLSEKQGYITQTEQRAAQFEQLFDAGDGSDPVQTASIAANVMRGLSSDPVNTIAQIVEVLAEAGITPEEVAATILGGDPADLEVDISDPTEADPLADDPRLQFIEQQMAKQQQEQADQAYEHVCKQIEATHYGFQQNVFDRYVLAEDGDIEAAYNAYKQDFPPQQRPPAPPVSGAGGPPPAPQKKYGSLDDAIGDFLSEDKAAFGR